jgi:hypothetical protein
MPFVIPEDLHPDLMPVSWLLGTWHGAGRGEYPSIEEFGYDQEVIFAHDSRPFLHYFSRTWITDDQGERVRNGALETGFLRPTGEDNTQLELVLAHATGFAEVWYGQVDGARITLATDIVARTSTAKEYTAGQRMYGLVDGDLMYAYDMAAEGHEMQSHLWGKLKRD